MPLVSAEIAVRCSYLACYAIHDNVHCILQQQSRLETRRERERESRETPLREPFALWIVKVSSRELGLIPDKGREAFSSRLFHYRIEDNRAEMPHPSVVLATAGYDHTIRFWEATTGRCYRTLQYTDSQVNKLEITPDKQYLAAAGNPLIRLFDVNSSHPHPVCILSVWFPVLYSVLHTWNCCCCCVSTCASYAETWLQLISATTQFTTPIHLGFFELQSWNITMIPNSEL